MPFSAALVGSAAAGETEKNQRIRQLERTLGRKSSFREEMEILKEAVGVSCGVVRSHARKMVTQAYQATLETESRY
jgi:hypothetical protein